jgi:GT2 family glycosyltransferase
MLISIIVGVTRADTLEHLVKSVLYQVYRNWELIIVGQGNDPHLEPKVLALVMLDSRIKFIHLSELGKAKALNQGIQVARGAVIAFTDDDCEADPQWLYTIAKCFEKEPEVGIVAGNVVAPAARPFQISTCPSANVTEFVYRPSDHNYQAPPFFFFIGANYALRTSILKKTGLFDEVFGPGGLFPGAEDTDFGLRAEALNIAIWTTPRSIIYHTYGRRMGIRQVLKHQKAYARGKGALIGKLTIMNHRLANEWSKEPTLKEKFFRLFKKPRWVLLEMYVASEVSRGKEEYLNHYVLAPDCTSLLKQTVQEIAH